MCLLNGASAHTPPIGCTREEAGCHVFRANRRGTMKENDSACFLGRCWETDAKKEHCWFLPHGSAADGVLCSSRRMWGRTNPRAALSAQSQLLGCYIPSLHWTLTYLLLSPLSSLPVRRTPSTESHRLLPPPLQRNLLRAPSQRVLLHQVMASH